MLVMKFGGTSVGSGKRIAGVAGAGDAPEALRRLLRALFEKEAA